MYHMDVKLNLVILTVLIFKNIFLNLDDCHRTDNNIKIHTAVSLSYKTMLYQHQSYTVDIVTHCKSLN